MLNPYREWLGIPENQLPANHYRLLGLETFEPDAKIISAAADRVMMYVRTFQTGKYSELSQKILNELSAARVCLLNPEKKAAYDQRLRMEQAPETAIPGLIPDLAAAASSKPPVRRAKKKSANLAMSLGLLAGTAILCAAAIFYFSGKDDAPENTLAENSAPENTVPEK